MQKISKKQEQIGNIKDVHLSYSTYSVCFDIIKSQVKPGQNIIVAVSGGADSILTSCLMYNFFTKNKYNLQNLFFIHCNHHTRSGNKNDESFIQNFFEGTQLIITRRKSTKKASEAELRTRRYQTFKKYCKQYNIAHIIFGHNLTDRIETSFLNLLRGANINGFLAMKNRDTHHLINSSDIIRPLLPLSKAEITQICQQHKIPFVTDPTNMDSTTSMRNKLRNTILPEIYALSHKQTTTNNSFIKSMQHIYQEIEALSLATKQPIYLTPLVLSPYRHAKAGYHRKIEPTLLTKEHTVEMLNSLKIANNITASRIQELTKFLQQTASGYKYMNNTYFFKSHGHIYIIKGPQFFRKKIIDKTHQIRKGDKGKREGIDYDGTQAKRKDTILRYPKIGDTYKNKTRNQYCINQKIPIFWRNFIPVITKNNRIIGTFKDRSTIPA